MSEHYDIVIVGNGMVGASLANAIKHLPCRIAMVEAVPTSTRLTSNFDARSIALSHGSQKIFSAMGIWSELAPYSLPINAIHVSDQGRFGRSYFTAEKSQLEALGYVVEAQDINRILSEQLSKSAQIKNYCPAKVKSIQRQGEIVTVQCDTVTLTTPLLVAADGGNSTVRQLLGITHRTYDYQQTAIVANVGLARPHRNIAYERFTKHGPLALLPMRDQRSALVWSQPPEKIQDFLALSETEFLQVLQKQFGYRLGQFIKVGQRSSFPLKLTISDEVIKPGVVLIGNASQALHPIAGQGFNLGLRDVATLAQVIRDGLQSNTLAKQQLLQTYLQWRLPDQRKTIAFSDFVPRVFSHDYLPLNIARDLGLCVVDSVPPIKNMLLKQNLGIAGKCPDLLCGVSL